MKKEGRFTQKLLWFFITVVICGMITIGFMTNITLRSIEKELPGRLLTELDALSIVLENLSGVVNSAEKASKQPTTENLNLLKTKVDAVSRDIVDLRETYVFDNLVKASAFHAVIAPAISDLQIWLSDGVSGYGPETKTTVTIAYLRIKEAFQKAQTLIRKSKVGAQKILEKQRDRLDRFLVNVNLLFILALIISFSAVYLLFQQHVLQRRESIAQAELRKQRDLLNSLFENVLLGVTVWNQEGELLLINKGFTKITGYTMHDIKTLQDWFHLAYPDPTYRNKVLEDWKRSTRKKNAIREFKIACKNSEVKDIEFRGTFLPDGRALVTLSDITDRKRAEKMIQKSREIEARYGKMESLGLLAGGVAHDLNNVLSGLVSYPDLILMELPADSPLREAILNIQQSGEKAAAIVQDLLTLARRGVSVSEVINLNDVVSNYIKSPEYEKLKTFFPDAKIRTELQGDLLNIPGSSVHLSKTVMNLVSNAVESLRGDGSVTISTRNEYIDRPIKGYDEVKEGDYVVLTVEDNGVGIADKYLEKIFEPFYTKKVMGRSGTGLGMAVVWGTIKDHNGYIDVESTEGKGSNFTLYFPITRKEPEKSEPLSIEDYAGNGEMILVVDDVMQQRDIATVLLKKLGYSVNAVSSGEEAIEFMQDNAVDLLVLDMIMDPGIDGLDTYRKVLELHPGQKAIIASGFSETDRVKEAQKLGAGQYVKKPYTLEKIGLAVKAELSR